MSRVTPLVACAVLLAGLSACRSSSTSSGAPSHEAAAVAAGAAGQDRPALLERVDDVAIVQVYADGFEALPLDQKALIWHLTQAALAGRDIYYAQKCVEGPTIRALIEEVLTHGTGVDPATLEEVRHYAKLFWVNNSPYNSITARKNVIRLKPDALVAAAVAAEKAGAKLPKAAGESAAALVARLTPMLCDAAHKPMVTAKNPERGQDILTASAVNFYGAGVVAKDLEGFKEQYELNSNVVKTDGRLSEVPWRAGDPSQGIPPGLYAQEITNIISHLTHALPLAPPPMRKTLEALIKFYRTGSAADFKAYNIAWVADKDSPVDTINGFIEVYLDPRGKKAGWEALVYYEDPKKAGLIKKVAGEAPWFEAHMPYDAEFRKPDVKGITARSINVVVEAGDSGPVTPVGINLPNADEVREQYGSKSVSLANIVDAYDRSSTPAARSEFCFDDAETKRAEKWGGLIADLHTNMHEAIGHASGRQAPDHQGDPATWIKENFSALEEARADLVALWFIMDPKLTELGLVDDVNEAALAEYEAYTRNGGLAQLRRMKKGDQLEEDHMRNRQMIVRWIQANSHAIEERTRDGKRFLCVTDAAAWREAAGRLLTLVQRIKSTGDYAGAKKLFDDFGVKFDPKLRDEVVARFAKVGSPAYTGFVMPQLDAVRDAAGAITDVRVSYPLSIEKQMLRWSGRMK